MDLDLADAVNVGLAARYQPDTLLTIDAGTWCCVR
jgi:hypothetical protein